MDAGPPGRWIVTPIAVTGGMFRGFGPYVPSVGEDGTVAFQAALADGGTGVFTDDGGGVRAALRAETVEVCSHPDIGPAGVCCFYGRIADGRPGVLVCRDGRVELIAEPHGPLGPTMNTRGEVAYRARHGDGREAILVHIGSASTLIAETGPKYAAFHGLPVINGAGSVVFRATMRDSAEGIFVADGATVEAVAITGDEFATLGLFPFLDDSRRAAFTAVTRDGSQAVFSSCRGALTREIETRSGFESFRGVLFDGAGRMVFYATPVGKGLGVYSGPDTAGDCVLSIGGPLLDSTVVELALNPVSINRAGRLAIRVRLADGREAIVRADRAGITACGPEPGSPRHRRSESDPPTHRG